MRSSPTLQRLMLVDDNPDHRALVIRALHRELPRLEVLEVVQNQQFTAALEKGGFDLVITDYQIGWTNGLEVFHSVRRRWPDCPVIMFTGTGSEQIAIDGLKAGIADYIVKSPNHFGLLPQTVISVLEQTKQRIVHRRVEKELRQKEAEFRAIFEQSAIGMALGSMQGAPIACNAAFERFLGYSSAELASLTFPQFTHPDDLEAEGKLAHSLIAGQRDHYQIEKRYLRKDGTTVWGRLNVSMIRDSANQPQMVVALVEDITASKAAKEREALLEAQLRQLQKLQALGTLAGGIAHDFNNILTAILGNAEIANLYLPPGHEVRGNLEEIRKASARAADLVRRILLFSREQESIRKLTPLQPVVEEALKLLRATLSTTIEIRAHTAPGLPRVLADSTQIHQIVMNLCTNAAHAMSMAGALLEVRLDTVTVTEQSPCLDAELRPGRYVRLTVSDNGAGMDKAVQQHIFEPFFTTKASGQGTGLGLSVVDGIVKNHEGAIAVHSELGQGTTFHVYFPAAEAGGDEIRALASEVFRGNGERLLYVDDEETLSVLMKHMLEHMGYRVTGFNNALQALQAFRSRPQDFDAVITDASMPGMAGTDLAREMLQVRPDIPIVLTSGYIKTQDTESARQIGIREVVLKPGTLKELGGALCRVFKHSPTPA